MLLLFLTQMNEIQDLFSLCLNYSQCLKCIPEMNSSDCIFYSFSSSSPVRSIISEPDFPSKGATKGWLVGTSGTTPDEDESVCLFDRTVADSELG